MEAALIGFSTASSRQGNLGILGRDATLEAPVSVHGEMRTYTQKQRCPDKETMQFPYVLPCGGGICLMENEHTHFDRDFQGLETSACGCWPKNTDTLPAR